ncbi:MAG TPA: hypothetical protein DDY98_08475 [Ruminococcaceae bacterium]|nr:hypothetical protein [Oscillospiraceae bacterium]
MNTRNNTYRIGKFQQLTRTVYSTSNGLPSNVATSLCFDKNGKLYVGTDKGLSVLENGKFTAVNLGIKNPKISMLAVSDKGLYIGVEKTLLEYNGKKVVSERSFTSNLVDIKKDGDNTTWVLTESVLYRLPEGAADFDMKIGVAGKGTCIAVSKNNTVYVGSDTCGLNALAGKRWHWSELTSEMSGLISDCVTCVDIDSVGNVWVGTDKGVCVYDNKGLWLNHDTVKALPNAHITGMAVAENGDRYFSTTTGLIHLHNGQLSYYGYKRWLPNMHATAVVLGKNGQFCVATIDGISVFESKLMSLEEKAIELRRLTETYNIRKDGWALTRYLDHEGVVSLDEGFIDNTDNDGHWTGVYLGAMCYEYACTKNEELRAQAKRSLLAMIRLVEVTGIEGFPARAIRYPDERTYGTGNREEWHYTTDKDGTKIEWLGETSSDEIVGHFYAYANYYDLVADEEEKKLIRDVVTKIMTHILDHKFRLIDTDGIPTTWANWDPDILNNDHKWIFEKGTNSLQILAFLKMASHITGDEKYEKLFRTLASDKHFAMNLMRYKIPDGHLCHIDDNHDFLMITMLMRYTDDPILRSVFAIGLSDHWNDERIERNAFFNFVYGQATGERFDIDNCIDELVDYPLDPVMWTLYNSHRSDLEWDLFPTELGMIPQLTTPLEPHSRRLLSFDSNRFICDSGIKGKAEELFCKSDDPTAFTMFPGTGNDKGMEMTTCTSFTHPYWFARYHGLIEEA